MILIDGLRRVMRGRRRGVPDLVRDRGLLRDEERQHQQQASRDCEARGANAQCVHP